MKRLLQENCEIVAKCQSKQLSEQEYKNLQKRLSQHLDAGRKGTASHPTKTKQKKGQGSQIGCT